MDRYPHEFSGGQRQRIGIARALAAQPDILVGDEPVSALDVSVQAQVINLLSDLKSELGLTLIVIAHDLAVVRHMSDRIAVMYLGQVVETGATDDVVANGRHPYTQALMSAVPEAHVNGDAQPSTLKGEIPSPINPPSGCRFRTRCPYATAECADESPQLREVSDQHFSACHFDEKINAAQAHRRTAPHQVSEITARRFGLFRAAVSHTIDTTKSVSEEEK
jgi:oligopeptide/dipeptide ABC transporter ATP-binding protein